MEFTHKGNPCVSNATKTDKTWSVKIYQQPAPPDGDAILLAAYELQGDLEKAEAERISVGLFLKSGGTS